MALAMVSVPRGAAGLVEAIKVIEVVAPEAPSPARTSVPTATAAAQPRGVSWATLRERAAMPRRPQSRVSSGCCHYYTLRYTLIGATGGGGA
jgi:hypothetical protein